MLEVALPKPAAQTRPLSFCVHHSQFGMFCTAYIVCAPAGTPGGAGWPLFEDELLEDELLEEDELLDEEDWLLDEEDDDDPESDELELDDGGSAGCAGVVTGVCGWEAAIEEDGFPPQLANPMKR